MAASKAKTMHVSQLKSGMVVSKPIITRRGQTIAKAGTVLTHSLISRMTFYGIEEAVVETTMDEEEEYLRSLQPAPQSVPQQPLVQPVMQPQPQQPQPVPQPVPTPQSEPVPEPAPEAKEEPEMTLEEKKREEHQHFEANYANTLTELKKVCEEIKAGNAGVSYDDLRSAAEKLFQSKTSLELFGMIHSVRALDDSVYAHSINVSMIARAIGKWLKFGKTDLDMLTLCGLLHDVGKLQIPDEVLNKTEKLTDEEFELIRKHATFGNKMLKEINADSRLCIAALQHHERYDGSGYPRGLDGDEIDNFASIIAIADVYDAMTASRAYRKPKCAFQVIAAFEDDGLKKYNPKYILTFLERIANLYQNAKVVLSDGRVARVVYINQSTLSRPVVEDSEKKMVDLSRTPGLTITQIL